MASGADTFWRGVRKIRSSKTMQSTMPASAPALSRLSKSGGRDQPAVSIAFLCTKGPAWDAAIAQAHITNRGSTHPEEDQERLKATVAADAEVQRRRDRLLQAGAWPRGLSDGFAKWAPSPRIIWSSLRYKLYDKCFMPRFMQIPSGSVRQKPPPRLCIVSLQPTASVRVQRS